MAMAMTNGKRFTDDLWDDQDDDKIQKRIDDVIENYKKNKHVYDRIYESLRKATIVSEEEERFLSATRTHSHTYSNTRTDNVPKENVTLDILWDEDEDVDYIQKEINDLIDSLEKNKHVLDLLHEGLQKPIVSKEVESFLLAHKEKDKDPVIFAHPPTIDMTGVHPEITKLCSTISAQLYEVESIEEFKLSTENVTTEVIVYDDHNGAFSPTSPPFCAVIVTRKDEKFMILGWGGTTTSIADTLNVRAASPQSSLAWRKHGEVIKAQGAMTGIVHNDIANHEEAIIEKVKKQGIREIITTGQSLGGGCAQIAHLTLRAQIEDGSSPWNDLEDVNVRSVNFCAPMTTVLVKPANDALVPVETDAFIVNLCQNSCNIVYENDVVPRGYRNPTFIVVFLQDAVQDFAGAPHLLWLERLLVMMMQTFMGNIGELSNNGTNSNDDVPNLLKVFHQYRHVGNVIFYENESTKPRVLSHKQFINIEYKTPVDGKNRMDEMTRWHMEPIKGPGLSYPHDQLMK